MNGNINEYLKITVGNQTPQGEVTHIFGVADDHIIFKNEEGILKIHTSRNDDVYREALRQSTSLSSEGGQKFQGNFLTQTRIKRLVNIAHTAFS